MRWAICLGLTLSLAACRQTVVLDESVFDGGGGGGGGADSGSETGMPVCSGPPIDISPQTPKVMVALDRSDGMTSRFGDSTPLAAARDALDQYSTRYQNVVWFGYSDFPGTSCQPQTCCGVGGGFSPPSPKLLGFSTSLHACDQNQSCGIPTGSQHPLETVLNTSGRVFPQSDDGAYILLITNRRPDCGSFGPGPGSCGDGGDVQGLISTLLGRGIATYVVAPGQIDQETLQCLRDLAVAGGKVTQPSYFQPSQDAAALNAAIGDSIRMIARDACTLYLEGFKVTMDSQNGLTLVGKNMQIVPRNGTDGWDVTNGGYTITLRGQWCDHLIDDGPANFQLYPNCGSRH